MTQDTAKHKKTLKDSLLFISDPPDVFDSRCTNLVQYAPIPLEKQELVGISHKSSGAMWRRHSCLPRRHSCRRLPSTLCHNREQVSRRVSTRQAGVPAPQGTQEPRR